MRVRLGATNLDAPARRDGEAFSSGRNPGSDPADLKSYHHAASGISTTGMATRERASSRG
jgi:hypothetical protein